MEAASASTIRRRVGQTLAGSVALIIVTAALGAASTVKPADVIAVPVTNPVGPPTPPLSRQSGEPPATTDVTPSAPVGVNYLPSDVVVLTAGTSRIFDFPRRLRRVSLADSQVADLQVINPHQINLIGHREGFTTLAVWDDQGTYEEREIRVDRYGKEQVLLNVIVAELDRSRMEQQAANWTAALPKYNVSLVGIGPGGAATPYSPTTNLASSTAFGLGTPNQTTIADGATGTLPAAGEIIPLLLSSALNYGLAWGNSVAQTQAFFNFLVICVEAGLGILEAIKLVGTETGRHQQAIGRELALVASAVATGATLGQALHHMAERSAIDELKPLAATLIQGEQLGAPIAPALRSSSDTLRTARRLRAEEAAQKTSVKILFPLVLFVLPAMLMVIVGPAVLRIIATLAN